MMASANDRTEMGNERDVTEVLQRFADGDASACDRLVSLVYGDLRRLARRQLRRLRFGETLDTTGLVHEAYLKMVDQATVRWKDRCHFFAVSASAMRHIIVDGARRRYAQKRQASYEHETLDDDQAGASDLPPGVLLDLEAALAGLAEIDEQMVRVVECRFFAGYTEPETAETLGMSLRTVQRKWKRARAWLSVALRDSSGRRTPPSE